MPLDSSKYQDQKSVELPNMNPKRQKPNDGNADRLSQSQQSAHQASVQDKASLATQARQQLAGINNSLEKIETDRNHAVEQVSDKLAYLYSPQTFQSDVLRRTAQKLGLVESPQAATAVEVVTLDSLGDCFANFADSIDYPAIAPSTALGCLPM